MAIHARRRGWGGPALVMLLIANGFIFGKPAHYPTSAAIALTACQLLAMAAAAGSFIVPAWASQDERRRQIALTGTLLILPWAFLTLMPGYGPPYASNLAMNHVRYIILFVSSGCLGAALFLLREPLADRGGDRLLAPLGQASGILAALIQLIWAAILIGWTMSEAHKPAAYLSLYGTPIGNTSDVLLFFAGLMTYVSTGLYALSFVRQRWLHPVTGVIIAIAATLAAAELISRGLQYPDLPDNWFTMPGMIVGIPAIPWLLPYLLGVSALSHAACEGEAA